MPIVTIYALLEDGGSEVSLARLSLARYLATPVAEMVARVINSLTGNDELMKEQVLVNPATLDAGTWNAPPLWLYVRPGRTALLEEKVHQLRNLLSEGFRALLLDPKIGREVRTGAVEAFDIEVRLK